jgi:hypothetical protein
MGSSQPINARVGINLSFLNTLQPIHLECLVAFISHRFVSSL